MQLLTHSEAMLTIRSQQLDLIADRRFSDKIADFLRRQFTEALELDFTLLEDLVFKQIRRAREYGFTEEGHIAVYVSSAWMLGETFDKRFSAAAATLSNPTLTTPDKADWLAEWTIALFEALEKSA